MGDELQATIRSLIKKSRENSEIMHMEYFLRGIDSFQSMVHFYNVNRDLSFIADYTPPPCRLLDFGCGFGIQAAVLARHGYQVIGLEAVEDKSLDHFFKGRIEKHKSDRQRTLDLIWTWLREETTMLDFKLYDGKYIPFNDGYFDIILAYAVLEHIPKDELPGILRELHRVLKPGGLLYIFQFPRAESYSEYIAHHLGLEAHEFLLSERMIINMIERHSFKIVYVRRSDLLIKRPRKLINLLLPALRPIESVLIQSPLSYFAHHLNLVAEKG